MKEERYYYEQNGGLIVTKHPLEDDGPLPEGMVRITKEAYDQILEESNQAEARRKMEPVYIRNREMAELRRNLNRTDYKAIKYAEGLLTEEEYAPIKAQRQAWRARINELEAEENE